MLWFNKVCSFTDSKLLHNTKYFIYFQEGIRMVFEKIKAILAEQFDEDEDSITVDTSLTDDLGADSLDLADVLMAVEDEFEVEIPDEDIENIKTVGDIVDYIEAKK